MRDVRPGDIMFARRLRPRSVEIGVRIGQLIMGETGYPQHVAVVVEGNQDHYTVPANPRIVQAMPRGAEEIEIGPEHFTDEYVYVRPAYLPGMELDVPSRDTQQGAMVAHNARAYVGTPYSFLDYAAIAGLHFGIKNGPIRRYVRSSGHMICSQLADQALTDAGWHTFSDGRLPQDVTPAALYRKLMAMPGEHRTGAADRWSPNAVDGRR
jgi:hypothetical protein